MTTYIKSGGVYKPLKPKYKTGGVYKPIKKLYCKVDGVYRLIHDDTYHPANLVVLSGGGVRLTVDRTTTPAGAVLVCGYVGGAEYRYPVLTNATLTVNDLTASGQIYVRIEMADPAEQSEITVNFRNQSTAPSAIVLQMPLKHTWIRFINLAAIGFVEGLVLMPSTLADNRDKYFITNANQVQWNNNPDFFKHHTSIQRSLVNITTVIFTTVGFDLSHVTNLKHLFSGTHHLDISTCVFPQKANYERAFADIRGTLTGIDAINTSMLEREDLNYFLANAILDAKLNLSTWCVPLVATAPTYFGKTEGYPESNPSYSVSALPIWGTCGNSTRTVGVASFNPPTQMGRYINSVVNFTQVTNGLYTLGAVSGVTYSKIRKLEFSLHFAMDFQTPWSYGFNGKVQVIVTFSNGQTVKGGIHTSGAFDPVKKTIATARMTNDTIGTYVQENYNSQYFTVVATAANPITSIQLYHGATWMGGAEEKYFAAGLRNILITSTL